MERQDPENVRFLCFFVTVLALFAKRNLVNRGLFKESDLGRADACGAVTCRFGWGGNLAIYHLNGIK